MITPAETDRVGAAALAHRCAVKELEASIRRELEAFDDWTAAVHAGGRERPSTGVLERAWHRAAAECRSARDKVETTLRALQDALRALAEAERRTS